jgi:hypothetical protein
LRHWIDAFSKKRPAVAILRHEFLFAIKPIGPAPQLAACRSDAEVQSASIDHAVGFRPCFSTFYRLISQPTRKSSPWQTDCLSLLNLGAG